MATPATQDLPSSFRPLPLRQVPLFRVLRVRVQQKKASMTRSSEWSASLPTGHRSIIPAKLKRRFNGQSRSCFFKNSTLPIPCPDGFPKESVDASRRLCLRSRRRPWRFHKCSIRNGVTGTYGVIAIDPGRVPVAKGDPGTAVSVPARKYH